MQDVFDEVLESGKPDFPFCLAWANHSWYSKTFDKDSTGDKLLMEQTYPGEEDIEMHFSYLNRAFRDKRYIKIDGMPLLVV
ncbi:glycoside hydrolase family 99-like domain-containing protein, partial [Dorea formicigenerans]